MAKRGDPKVQRLVVIFLRCHSGMTQAEFGKASRVDQADVSRYEWGHRAPSEEVLRRMAKVASIDWPLVVHLRQFYTSFLAAVARQERGGSSEGLSLEVFESALLALTPYLLEIDNLQPTLLLREDELREAEQIWIALEEHPILDRGRLIELSPRSGSWALAVRVCEASVKSAAREPGEALQLTALALSIAERYVGEESSRSRLKGYCWAHVGIAKHFGKDLSGAEEAFARARRLWGDAAKLAPNRDGIILPSKGELLDRARAVQRQGQRANLKTKLCSDWS